jgi:hypothetical protein
MSLLFIVAAVGLRFLIWRAGQPLKELVSAEVVVGSGCDDPKFPVLVTLTNNAYKTSIDKVEFAVSVKQAGRSSTLARDVVVSDIIIEPRTTSNLCVQQPWERQRTLERIALGDLTNTVSVNIDRVDEVPASDRQYFVEVITALGSS